jgi:hypothetical protein
MSLPRYRFATAAAVLALVSASACSDEPDPPPIVWEGEHLRFGTDADDSTICAGTLPYLDGVVGHLGEVFGHPDAQVDYYWLPDGVQRYCPAVAEGCADDRGVFSQYTLHQHELVHAIRYPNLLYEPIEEGLAEAYGDDWDRFPIAGDIHDLLRDPADGYIPGPGYGLAGHFVSYLDAAHGLDTLVELDAATNYESSFSQAEAAFQRIYGQSLDAEITDYKADYPRCNTASFRDKAFDCSRNVVAAPTEIDAKLDMTVAMACDDPAVLGPRFGERWTTVTLDVEVAGRYHIVVTPVDNLGLELIRITRCDLSCFEHPDDLLSRTTGTHLNASFCLEPAQYLFRLAIAEDELDDYRLIVTRTDYPACD